MSSQLSMEVVAPSRYSTHREKGPYRVVVIGHVDPLAHLQAVDGLHDSMGGGHGGGSHEGADGGELHVGAKWR